MLTQNAGKVFGWGHDDGNEVHPRRECLNLGDVRSQPYEKIEVRWECALSGLLRFSRPLNQNLYFEQSQSERQVRDERTAPGPFPVSGRASIPHLGLKEARPGQAPRGTIPNKVQGPSHSGHERRRAASRRIGGGMYDLSIVLQRLETA